MLQYEIFIMTPDKVMPHLMTKSCLQEYFQHMLAFLDKGKRQRHNQCIELRGPERNDNIDALFYLNSVQV